MIRTLVIVVVMALAAPYQGARAASSSGDRERGDAGKAGADTGDEARRRAKGKARASGRRRASASQKSPARTRGQRPSKRPDAPPTPSKTPSAPEKDPSVHEKSQRLKGRRIRLPLTDGKQVVGLYVSHSWKSIRLQSADSKQNKPVEVAWDKVKSDVALKLLKKAIDHRSADDHLRLGQYMVRRGRIREAEREFRLAQQLDRKLGKKVRKILGEEKARRQWDEATATTRPSAPTAPDLSEGNPLDRSTPEKKPTKKLDRAMWFETAHQTGRRANRIDVVCVGDGYSGRGLRFRKATLNLSKAFRRYSPFSEYYGLFNFHMVHVNMKAYDYVKTESGKASIFGVSKSLDDDEMLTSDRETVLGVVERAGVVADVVCLLVSNARGGSGSAGSTTSGRRTPGYMTVGDKSDLRVYVHEAGHALAGLADEYERDPRDGARAAITAEPTAPNVTIDRRRSRCKWRHWFSHKAVGMYEGALYQHRGVFRPSRKCVMRDDNRFCPVCREALALAFLKRVRLIDRVEPEGNVIETFTARENVFRVWTIPVSRRTLDLKWRIGGQKVNKKWQKGPDQLVFPEGALKPGEYTITVKVQHRTSFVRRDPEKWTQDRFAWQVTVKE